MLAPWRQWDGCEGTCSRLFRQGCGRAGIGLLYRPKCEGNGTRHPSRELCQKLTWHHRYNVALGEISAIPRHDAIRPTCLRRSCLQRIFEVRKSKPSRGSRMRIACIRHPCPCKKFVYFLHRLCFRTPSPQQVVCCRQAMPRYEHWIVGPFTCKNHCFTFRHKFRPIQQHIKYNVCIKKDTHDRLGIDPILGGIIAHAHVIYRLARRQPHTPASGRQPLAGLALR